MSNDQDQHETASESAGAIVSDGGRKVTWHYERKVGLADYSSEAVSIFVTDHVPDNMSAVQVVMDRTEAATDILKAQVWKALGLEFEWKENGHPVLVQPAPPQQPVASPQTQPPVAVPPPSAPGQVAPPAPAPAPQPTGPAPSVAQVGFYAEAPSFCKDCGAQGVDSFYDNRGEVDQAIQNRERIGPDYRCKTCKGGSGKKGGLFRPGSYEYNTAVKAGQDPYAGPSTAPPPF